MSLPGSPFVSWPSSRAPIHLGSGEPVLLLHPFLLSQAVWQAVAQQLADTGRYEVFAPTMAGHNGGPPAAPGCSARRRWPTMWNGNSMNWAGIPRTSWATRWAAGSHTSSKSRPGAHRHRRRRGRRLDAMEPGQIRGDRQIRLRMRRFCAYPAGWGARTTPAAQPPVGHAADQRIAGRSQRTPIDAIIDDVPIARPTSRCWSNRWCCRACASWGIPQSPPIGALREGSGGSRRAGSAGTSPTPCRPAEVTTLDGLGHVPMFEAPGRITEAITDFLDQCTRPPQAVDPAGGTTRLRGLSRALSPGATRTRVKPGRSAAPGRTNAESARFTRRSREFISTTGLTERFLQVVGDRTREIPRWFATSDPDR